MSKHSKTITYWGRRLAEAQQARQTARSVLAQAKVAQAAATTATAATAQAQAVVQGVAQAVQQQAHTQIAAIVTRCLAAVFPNPYKFHIAFERKRGKTEAQLQFIDQNDNTITDPLNEVGGGVIDVAAFGLRLAALVLASKPRRRLLLLDEPFANLSAEYRPVVAELIEELSHELGVQIILVTHYEEFHKGKVVKF